MQKYVLVLGLVLSFVGCTYAEQSATACFDLGFNAAAKAFNAGDKSAFTPVYGMSPAMISMADTLAGLKNDEKITLLYKWNEQAMHGL